MLNSTHKVRQASISQIRTWFNGEHGTYLLSLEKPIIDKALSYYFGRFLLQAGPLFSLHAPIRNMTEIVSVGISDSGADIIHEEHAWPILTEGVECVVLHHALDFASSPHDVLREAARCVRPGGHLLIVGFNPYSLWGIYRHCTRSVLNKTHSLSYMRLTDWLRLLGFSVERQWKGGYGLPKSKWTKLELMGQRKNWFGNGFYIISARKLMVTPTPSEKKRRSILGGLAPIPVVNRSDAKIND